MPNAGLFLKICAFGPLQMSRMNSFTSHEINSNLNIKTVDHCCVRDEIIRHRGRSIRIELRSRRGMYIVPLMQIRRMSVLMIISIRKVVWRQTVCRIRRRRRTAIYRWRGGAHTWCALESSVKQFIFARLKRSVGEFSISLKRLTDKESLERD